MGYYSTVRGSIEFTPPIRIDELRANPNLSKYESGRDTGFYPDMVLTSADNILYNTIECAVSHKFKAYDVKDNLDEIVNALPDRSFTGRLEVYGEEESDIYGYRVKNGVVELIQPTLVWPNDAS